MSERFLLGESGYNSGMKIRPIRVLDSVDELRAALHSQGFPSQTRELPYRTRVYLSLIHI